MKLKQKLASLKHEGGFTLIEMLIVVAIIGILVAIAVPALNTAKKDAQDSKREAIESAVATAKTRYVLEDNFPASAYNTAVQFSDIEKYLLVNGSKPTSQAALEAGTGNTIGNLGTYPDPVANTGGTGITWQ